MVSQGMQHPWAIPAALAVVALAVGIGWLLRRGSAPSESVRWIANAGYLTELSAYRSQLTVYRVGLGGAVAVLLLGALGVGTLLARPIERQIRNDELATRDIVLCLDVSGSMINFDTEIVDKFLELTDSFQGERISLSIWNSTSRTVFPLTDDYTLVREELLAAREALDFDINSLAGWAFDQAGLERLLAFIDGTEGGGDPNSSSLVGDALASCALQFDEADTERSRSIILATDNQVLGQPIYTLTEAAELVAEREITLIGLYAGETTITSEAERKEFETVVAGLDGLFFEASDPTLVDGVIDDISAQQAVDLDATPEVVITDRPETAYAITVIAVSLLLVGLWRLRT